MRAVGLFSVSEACELVRGSDVPSAAGRWREACLPRAAALRAVPLVTGFLSSQKTPFCRSAFFVEVMLRPPCSELPLRCNSQTSSSGVPEVGASSRVRP